MSASLVGSEMCIRDSSLSGVSNSPEVSGLAEGHFAMFVHSVRSLLPLNTCLLYTSDAADDM
eukprot:11458700-Alexandrium_andersonii.AAC.1